MQAGRLARVRMPYTPASESGGLGVEGDDWGWGIVLDFRRKGAEAEPAAKAGRGKKGKGGKSAAEVGAGTIDQYTVDMLLRCAEGAEEGATRGVPPTPAVTDPAGGAAGATPAARFELCAMSVPLAHLDGLSSIRLTMPPSVKSSDARHGLLKVLSEVGARFPAGPPPLAPDDEMKIDDPRLSKLLRKVGTAGTLTHDGGHPDL